MPDLPFSQVIEGEKIIRTFLPTIDVDELKWHRDQKDRKIQVIESGGWEYQSDDNLPVLLEDNMTFFISKDCWHRVIAGHDKLIVEIEELD